MAMTIEEIRSKRRGAEITSTLLAVRAGIHRSRLSCIEHGYVQPSADELRRLQATLEKLIEAKAAVQKTAASVGWPMAAGNQ